MEKQGQGAIEYLLIIAAAILVVAIVILAVTGTLSGGQGQGDDAIGAQQDSQMALGCQTSCDFTLTTDDGTVLNCYDTTIAGCTPEEVPDEAG